MATIVKVRDPSELTSAALALKHKYEKYVLNLPQVKSGLVDKSTAQDWLSHASSILSEHELRRQIHESKGFNEQDIRALWAQEHNEYYSKYHASEVYSLKRLESLSVPSEQDKKSIALQSLFKALIKEKYKLNSIALSTKPNPSGEYKWVNSTPSIMQTESGDNILIAVKFNYKQSVTQSDDIRNHVQLLSLLNANQKVDAAYQYNITIPDNLLDVLATTALMSEDGFKQSLSMAKTWEQHSSDVNIEFDRVKYSKELFSSISKTTTANWQSLLAGHLPSEQKQADSSMSPRQEAAFNPVAKRYAAAQRLAVSANKAFDEVKGELAEIVSNFGEPRKLDSTFDLVKVGSRSVFNLDGAVSFLQRNKVDEAHYLTFDYDMKGLLKAAISKNIDPSNYRTFGKPSKSSVIDALEKIGVNPEKFMTNDNHIHFTGQSRGEVYERVKDLENQTDEVIEHSISSIGNTLIAENEENKAVQEDMELV